MGLTRLLAMVAVLCLGCRLTFADCPPRPALNPLRSEPRYNSQVGQDRVVFSLLGNHSRGFFVDLAANDPKCISNTYTLEKWLGWNGICIEGNPFYIPKLRKQRDCTVIQTAVDTTAGQTVRFRVDNMYMGGIVSRDLDNKKTKGRSITLQTQTLEGILDEHCAPRTIDYLSLDVEGAEWRVLQNFSFSRYQFRIMSIERPGKKLGRLLRMNGYTQVKTLGPYGDELWLSTAFLRTLPRRAVGAVKAFKPRVTEPQACKHRSSGSSGGVPDTGLPLPVLVNPAPNSSDPFV
uniref:Methyltransferase FkbM domain-containing protein n=1 Tax=Eutreptiella gymnastica TaxID=73025 RepID=A0A7S1NIZ9_9EUGL|mmetsp:Transcript_3788/g.6674  ORF Transcript_3788/g.6674 Transcript_3788/m.6674 type:complete len:291 (+) Transcript_3788:114-986(+)